MTLATSPPAKTIAAGGLTILTEELPWLQSIAVGLFVPFGSVNEIARTNGAAHFIEHLVFKGTKKRSARDIALAIERYGGSLNAATEKEMTSYYCRIDARRLETALEVLADLCFHAQFKPSLVNRERTVVVEEIEGNLDDPDYFLFDAFLQQVWGNSGLGRPITGTPHSVQALSRDELFTLWQTHYRPERMVLSVTGGVSHAQVVDAWNGIWHRMGIRAAKKRAAAPRIPRSIPHYRPGVHVWMKPVEQASVIVGMEGIRIGAPERHTLACMDGVLAAGMGSRLFQALRERRGLVYDVSSLHLPFRGTGLYLLEASCNPARLEKVVGGILRELQRLRERPVPAAELKRVKDFLAGSFTLSLESSSNRMFRLALSHMYLGHYEDPREVLERLMAVTPADIQGFAQGLFAPEGLSLGAVVPEGWKEPQELVAWLRELLDDT